MAPSPVLVYCLNHTAAPRSGQFLEMPVKDKSFIPDISELWRPEANIFSIASDFLEQLSSVREVSEGDKKKIQNAIGKLHGLTNHYRFTALTLSATVDGATVADVFVRINGEGKQLNQSDFIMTLMSVHWDEGRTELEAFARAACVFHDMWPPVPRACGQSFHDMWPHP